jgi:adenylate kinase
VGLRLIFIGAPGVGKGTQAARLAKERTISHLATGEMLRTAVARQTPAGKMAKVYMNAGQLVPDAVIIDTMRDRLAEPDTDGGYILDGFPRTLGQAEALGAMLAGRREKIDRVIHFSLAEATLVERIAGRRTCSVCQAIYHVAYQPPRQEGRCDCGGALIQRKDDLPETVKARLIAYANETAPLIECYRAQGLLSQIDASESMDAVAARVNAAITCNGE